MKFKTRLRVTFIAIIGLPLLLTILAFVIIGFYLMSMDKGLRVQEMDYSMMSENLEEFIHSNDRVYDYLKDQAAKDVTRLEDISYLEEVNSGIARRTTYLLVRKENEIYYAGNPEGAKRIFEQLPAYGEAKLSESNGIYFDREQRYVKQLDFMFHDGSQGSVFVVTRVNNLISKALLRSMLISIIAILVFTSAMLTGWIHKGVFTPIKELNEAMKKIKAGNLDYVLQTTDGGEIGDLYQNYEDMRLRLKESALEKEEQEKRNKELISNISHDLKTPITAIKGYVEGIMDGVADSPDKMDKYIKTIYSKANDMDRLINELTVYSHIDNDRIPYNFRQISVSDYFGDCVEEVGMDLESHNIQLNFSNMLEEDAVVIADPEQLKKVINNIISNSVKYMDKSHGVIDIRLLDEQDSIRVEIEDNGKGIAQKDLQKVFDRFYRTDTSRNSAQGGSGIGLSIVKKIIEDHGGYIWATSKEGEGTCIHFVIRKYIDLNQQKA